MAAIPSTQTTSAQSLNTLDEDNINMMKGELLIRTSVPSRHPCPVEISSSAPLAPTNPEHNLTVVSDILQITLTDIEDALEQYQTTDTDFVIVEPTVEGVNEMLKQIQAAIEEALFMIDDEEEEIAKLRVTSTEDDKEILQLLERVETHKKTITSLRSAKFEVDGELKRSQREICHLALRSDKLQLLVSEYERDRQVTAKANQDSVFTWMKDYTDLQKKLQQAQKGVEQAEKETFHVSEAAQQAKQEAEQAKTEIAQVKTEIDQAKQDAERANKQAEQAEKETFHVNEVAQQAKQEAERAKTEFAQAKEEAVQARKEADQAVEEAVEEAEQAKMESAQAKEEADQAKKQAVQAKEEAKQARKLVVQAAKEAVQSRAEAVQARDGTIQAKKDAVQAQKLSEIHMAWVRHYQHENFEVMKDIETAKQKTICAKKEAEQASEEVRQAREETKQARQEAKQFKDAAKQTGLVLDKVDRDICSAKRAACEAKQQENAAIRKGRSETDVSEKEIERLRAEVSDWKRKADQSAKLIEQLKVDVENTKRLSRTSAEAAVNYQRDASALQSQLDQMKLDQQHW